MNGPRRSRSSSYAARRLPGRRGVLAHGRRGRARRASTSTPCFEHEWETGLAPDEVNYTPGVTPPDLHAAAVQRLEGRPLARRARRSPERNAPLRRAARRRPGHAAAAGQHDLEAAVGQGAARHQDAAYVTFLEPPNMTTCWMALDDTHADTGTIYYARGSNHWPRLPHRAARSTRPTTGWATCASVRAGRASDAVERVPIEVPAGGCGVPRRLDLPRLAAERARRSPSGARSSATWSRPTRRWHPTNRAPALLAATCGPASSRSTRRSFPIMWREDGHRTPYIDRDYAPAALA